MSSSYVTLGTKKIGRKNLSVICEVIEIKVEQSDWVLKYL